MHSMIWLTLVLCGVLAPTVHVINGEPATIGFTSIDCGVSSGYTSTTTNITYTSDDGYIDTGDNYNIAANYVNTTTPQQSLNLRSFGTAGARNCYTLSSEDQNKYLLRASFMYGNYDGKSSSSLLFDLHIGVNRWATVNITDASVTYAFEAITVASRNSLSVCLINTGHGTPFISSLEMRPWKTSMYPAATADQYLLLLTRLNIGAPDDAIIRYPLDLYDRIWQPYNRVGWTPLSTTANISIAGDTSEAPSSVLQTAAEGSTASRTLTLEIDPGGSRANESMYYIAHFSDFQNSQLRMFDIFLNGKPRISAYRPYYLKGTYVYSTSTLDLAPRYDFSFNATSNSTLPPILNGFELYSAMPIQQPLTFARDVDAIAAIKAQYAVKRNWIGDPCAPSDYAWEGLKCSYTGTEPRIIHINLSDSALAGAVSNDFSSLTSLHYLDLSYNNLIGSIPDSLANLPSLQVLNLSGNCFSDPIPDAFSNRKSLILRNDGNGDACNNKRTKSTNIIIVSVVVAAVVLTVLVVLVVVVVSRKKRKQKDLVRFTPVALELEDNSGSRVNYQDCLQKSESRRFTYKELERITNKFSQLIGRGGFGAVYHGHLENGTEVAVKVRSESRTHGLKEFLAEVESLTRVHHRNLVSLVGYCWDKDHYLALVYEYMAHGSLFDHLRGNSTGDWILSWRERVRIALEAAQGLDYLHKGCVRPIIHRDIKTHNILLGQNFQAKIADFGLSKAFLTDTQTHISVTAAGTTGYMDPEYYYTGQLTEGSDVYSFGVVLLELVTGEAPVVPGEGHIVHRMKQRLVQGSIDDIADARLGGAYEVNSVWKVVDVGMMCTADFSDQRPTMAVVVAQLKECLALEEAREGNNSSLETTKSISDSSVCGMSATSGPEMR